MYKTAIKEKAKRINELRYNLKQIDYKTNKYVEGELSEEEWAEVKAQRKAWRDEINALQAEVGRIHQQFIEKIKGNSINGTGQ